MDNNYVGASPSYDMNWTCDWLLQKTDSGIFTDEFRERLAKVIIAARKYELIKDALNIKE